MEGLAFIFGKKYINLLTRGPTQTLMLKLKFIHLVVTGHLLMVVIYK